jgi:hypothetical protein
VDREAIHHLRKAAGPFAGHLAAGAPVAATFRLQTGESAAQTDLACEVLCGLPSAQVARVGRDLRQQLLPNGAVPAFAIWRQLLVEQFALSSAQEFVSEERTP